MNKKKYNFGGFLKKALPVAGAAANFIPGVGPIAGMAINAGANAISGAIPEEEKGGEKPVNNFVSTPPFYGYAGGGKLPKHSYMKGSSYVNKKANGGPLSAGTMTAIRGDAGRYDGPKHEQGGIPVDGQGNPTTPDRATAEVEGGETKDGSYIFSDRLTVPGSDKTFADLHQELLKQGADDPQIEKLKALQRRVQRKVGGGMNKRKGLPEYALGTPAGAGVDIASQMNEEGGWFSNPANQSFAASLIPDVANAITGATAKDQTLPATQVDKGSLRNFPTTYNINPLLTSNAAGYRGLLADKNMSTVGKLSGYGQKLQADSQAYAQKSNQENQLASRKASLEGRLDMTQSRYDDIEREGRSITQANIGIGGNFARGALSNIADKFSKRSAQQAMRSQDNEQVQILANLIARDPDLMQRMLDQMNYGQ